MDKNTLPIKFKTLVHHRKTKVQKCLKSSLFLGFIELYILKVTRMVAYFNS
jgi:hypothetical protein